MNRILVAAVFAILNTLVLFMPAPALAGPQINQNLKEATNLIPIPAIKGQLNALFDELKPLADGSGFSAKKTIAGLPLQLYLFGDADKQAILLVVNSKISIPGVFNNSGWKRFAGSSFTDPIFSLSTVDFSLDTKDMPDDFKKIVASSYFNVDSLDFTSGFQIATKATIGGIMKQVMEVTMSVPVQSFTMRAGVVLPFPADANARAGLAISVLSDMKNVGNMAKEAPEFFVELQPAPDTVIAGPLGMSMLKLSDATFSMNNKGTVGYKGNIMLPGGKKLITFFESPLAPTGAMDLVDFTFGLAAQTLTLEDYVNISLAFATPKVPGGNFVKDINKYKDKLLQLTKPLLVFQLRNPKPVPDYKFGDKSKPFPPLDAFNILLLGPLASVDDADGKTVQGPLIKVIGNARVLGQQIGKLNVMLGSAGLHGKVGAGLSLKLGPLGKQGITMLASADISDKEQLLNMHGNVLGRTLDMNMDGLSLSLNSPATCLTPFEISAKYAISKDMDVGALLDSLPGVNVDPAQLAGCVGEDLKKALKWVSSTGASLGGYSAKSANEALKKIDNAAAEAARKAEEEANRAYQRTKDAARNAAENSTNSAMNALNDAGNSIKRAFGGKKKKNDSHREFDPTVFDWDYYYDEYPDVVKSGMDLAEHWRDHGFGEGRQGSNEFLMRNYRARYSYLHGSDKDVLNHWLGDGINQGLQASPSFSVRAYLDRYPDLQQAFGRTNYRAAMEHWLNSGRNEGRNGRP